MTASLRVPLIASVLSLWCLASGALLHAQRFAPSTTAEAVAKARTVVAATVVDVSVRSEGWIYTYVEFETQEVLKGSVPARFTARMMGGRVGTTQTANALPLPQFAPGDAVVLLLADSAPGGPAVLYQEHVYYVRTAASGVRTVTPAPTGMGSALLPSVAAGAAGPDGGVRYADFLTALRKLK